LVYALPGEKEKFSEKTSNFEGVLPSFTPEAGPAIPSTQEPSTQEPSTQEPKPEETQDLVEAKLTSNTTPRLNLNA